MGWLYMQSLGGHSGPRQYLDAQFTYERQDRRVRVLRSSLVKMRTYDAAIEIAPTVGEREVIAVVCLVRYNPRDAEGYVFGYKDMDETMGPCEAECPAVILDLLTPTKSEFALAWRVRCRAVLAKRASIPKLRDGDLVVFTEPIKFTDGSEHRRMKVVVDRHKPRALRFRRAAAGSTASAAWNDSPSRSCACPKTKDRRVRRLPRRTLSSCRQRQRFESERSAGRG